jgi:hypothetical protein
MQRNLEKISSYSYFEYQDSTFSREFGCHKTVNYSQINSKIPIREISTNFNRINTIKSVSNFSEQIQSSQFLNANLNRQMTENFNRLTSSFNQINTSIHNNLREVFIDVIE